MGFIRFQLTRTTDSEGRTVNAFVKRMESDMPTRMSPEYIFHELARTNVAAIKMWLELDKGVLDRDMMMGAEVMLLDSGVLDCDTLI